MGIKENCERIIEKIHEAELRAGRKEGSVRLMAVSKFHPAEAVEEAVSAGMTLFGENRVQEACSKFPPLIAAHPEIELHLIGSLQRNKVKHILPVASCIQSVDRIELIEEIVKQKEKLCPEKKLKLLFELHTGEESKAGFPDLDALLPAVELAAAHASEGIISAGFMTMAPAVDDAAQIRSSFRKLVKVAEEVRSRFPELPLTELSMGMSHDFDIAVEEGSTMVRVGTAIFGERQYV